MSIEAQLRIKYARLLVKHAELAYPTACYFARTVTIADVIKYVTFHTCKG